MYNQQFAPANRRHPVKTSERDHFLRDLMHEVVEVGRMRNKEKMHGEAFDLLTLAFGDHAPLRIQLRSGSRRIYRSGFSGLPIIP